MKRIALILALLAETIFCYSQPTSGMFAHWDMNGTTNDVSGSGLNGNGNNLTPAAGSDGIMGHAWYFNGANSSITIPYAPAFNVPSAFTIAAAFMVEGFYTGPCHANMLFIRGKTTVRPASYFLYFSDAPAGYGCNPGMDTMSESFISTAIGPSGGLIPPVFTSFDHTPHVLLNKWYSVVTTFNDTVFKIYINDTLVTTVAMPTPGLPMGTSTDSAAIGYAPYDAPGYPYWFKGVMDDIKLYNRALSPCEVSKLTFWTSTLITANPVNDTTPVAGLATFTISDTGNAGTYRWQVNTGSGFTNVIAASPYSGVTSRTLTVNPVTSVMNNYQYRCIRTSASGCIDTSGFGKLVIGTTGINVLSKQEVSVIPNPASSSISISAPVALEKIEIFNIVGQKLISAQPGNAVVKINIESLPPGMYILRLNDSYTDRFVKE